MRAPPVNDLVEKTAALVAGGGTMLAWAQSIDAGAITTLVVAITAVAVWAYKQIEAARRESRVAWITEIERAKTDAQLEAAQRMAEFEQRQDHADARIADNAGRIGALKGELKDKGVIDGSADHDPPIVGGGPP